MFFDLVNKLNQWLAVPRDVETIRRSVIRRINLAGKKSSNLLISGDAFKLQCDFSFCSSEANEIDVLERFQSRKGRLFVQALPESNSTSVLVEACETGMRFPEMKLVIHNGDRVPNEHQMHLLSQSFQSVFSVNWLGDNQIAKPLPIGLENAKKLRNGVPSDYLKLIEAGLPSFESRDINLLVCFSVATNPQERSEALIQAREIPGVLIIDRPITPRTYRKLLLRSKFVLSPPGNGVDCHRTWEAMYLKAIPVVKKKYWPFNEYSLPVVRVSQWNQLSEKLKPPHDKNIYDWKSVSSWLI